MPTSSQLNIAVISLNISWCDPDENRYSLSKALDLLSKDTDVAVVPELFTTGFLSDQVSIDKYSEYWEDSPTLIFLKEMSAKHNMALCGSFMIKASNGLVLNRAVFVEPSGEVTHYDKHHLFMLSDEPRCFQSGNDPVPVIRFRGWNIAMAICYDLRFPTWLRNRDCRYDLLLLPANWPTARQYAWKHLLSARAIENQAYVAGANRSGHDDYGEYDNMSAIYDFMGKDITTYESSKQISYPNASIITASLTADKLNKARKQFPVLNDAD